MQPTLIHSPMSRSTTVRIALAEMGVTDRVTLKTVGIRRTDGSGGHDPENPHPEGKVPLLLHNGHAIWERAAILIYLTELFPGAPAIRPPGHPERGVFLSWLAYYSAVVEPVLVCQAAGLEHPWLHETFRGPAEMLARIESALADGQEYLLQGGFTVADLIMASPFQFFPETMQDRPAIKAWVQRVSDRPFVQQITQDEMPDPAPS